MSGDRSLPEKLRGRQTVLPTWWLAELQIALKRYIDEFKGRWSYRWLGEHLAELADRRLDGKIVPWDRKTVERFAKGENPTEELVEAFCLLFTHLIKPTFVARSRMEALELGHASRKFEEIQSNPDEIERGRRADELRGKRAEMEARAKDQTARVDSNDGTRKKAAGGAGGGRSRGVGRGRSSPS